MAAGRMHDSARPRLVSPPLQRIAIGSPTFETVMQRQGCAGSICGAARLQRSIAK
jgi:hypothetical protein